ncbi:hypothetical protein AYI70_g1765 [Smittium culicis]|uniref:Uncharacterized protein n=1 Tax=Smittium culicis TaxID=133412 RepID=A0A1R1YBD5_9FUNG|nr:hypothetical protein AYI70_g1765 [Smittium culicis]
MYQRYLNSFIKKSQSDLAPKTSYKDSTKTYTTENSNEIAKHAHSSANSNDHISRFTYDDFLYSNKVFESIPRDYDENFDIGSTQVDENLIHKFEEISSRYQKSIKIDSLCDMFYSWADITNTLLNSREIMESKVESNQISRIFKKLSQHIKARYDFIDFNKNPQHSLHKRDLSELTNFNFSNLVQTTEESKISKDISLYSGHTGDFDHVYNHSSFHVNNDSINLPSPAIIGLGSNLNSHHNIQDDTFESNSRFISPESHGYMENLSQRHRFKLQNAIQVKSFMKWKAKSSKLVNTLVNFSHDGSDALPLKKIHKYFHFWRRMSISLKLNRDQSISFSSDTQSLQDHVSISHVLKDSYNDSVYIDNYRQNFSSDNHHINQMRSFSDNTDSIINFSIITGKSGDIPESILNHSVSFNQRYHHNKMRPGNDPEIKISYDKARNDHNMQSKSNSFFYTGSELIKYQDQMFNEAESLYHNRLMRRVFTQFVKICNDIFLLKSSNPYKTIELNDFCEKIEEKQNPGYMSFFDNEDYNIKKTYDLVPKNFFQDKSGNASIFQARNLERLKAIEDNSINSVYKSLSIKKPIKIKNNSFFIDNNTLEKRNLSISDTKDKIILDIVKSSINILKKEPDPDFIQLFHSNYIHGPTISLNQNENVQLDLKKNINPHPITFFNDIASNLGNISALNENNNKIINKQINARELEGVYNAEKSLTIFKEKRDVLDDNEIVIEPDFFSNRKVLRICFLFWVHRSSISNLVKYRENNSSAYKTYLNSLNIDSGFRYFGPFIKYFIWSSKNEIIIKDSKVITKSSSKNKADNLYKKILMLRALSLWKTTCFKSNDLFYIRSIDANK